MENSEKKTIQAKLTQFCEIKGSQNKAANALKGVSSATISQVLNDNWDLITDEMWRKIAAQIGHVDYDWVTVKTRAYDRMCKYMSDARRNSLVLAVIGDAGSGKSYAIKQYAAINKNVYHLSCCEHWQRKQFVIELSKAMGLDASGCNVYEIMEDIIIELKKDNKPLIILDEADKLSDQVLYFFISLYNQLEDHAGIILCATEYLKKRIENGVRNKKKGYKEIYSRHGRRFLPLHILNSEDIAAVCIANGVLDTKKIEDIIADSDHDLRRVKRKIHALKQQLESV